MTSKELETIFCDPEVMKAFNRAKRSYSGRYKSETCNKHYKANMKQLRQMIQNGPSKKAKFDAIW